ncbi:TRAP transporter substrate-binding protein DctP [Spirochaeta africana]|uniref:TRAP-type C4-dicarboxylate transport system, periplasmic component n=1 Tax=Spirochaeta africana (strain ATCC 700263 / DSM 8902 / Z-7692) TaxID=889378 RepID=H9UL82_SPIAZ|nr:TRAP transporter substrate-binding protein DctP [Spirochaeta africana]AFG38275.1 TRAP-type C4-dicarboxylate transport system, periplasmic component [Spirochaeta africana DSM 8902]
MVKCRKLLVFLSYTVLFAALTSLIACGADEVSEGDVIEARLASEEIEGDFMTVWAEYFAEHMYEETDGQFQLDVYPFGTLGDNRDINELAQIGVVEFVFSDFAWISAFVPEAQVLSLHYLWPRERMPEVLEWVVNEGNIMAFLEDAFRQNGLVPLGIVYEGWQWITSQPEARTLDDLAGLRTRVMGSRLLVEDYRAYNMSPTPMDYGEVYSALQTGLIDAQVNPLFANYSMGFYEVTDYFTQMWAEPFLGIPTVNMQFFDSLPQEMQDLMMGYFKDNIIAAADWIDERNAADRARIEEERPDIVWTEWDDAEIEQARELAMTVWEDTYPDIAGDGAVEALEILLEDIQNAQIALGME